MAWSAAQRSLPRMISVLVVVLLLALLAGMPAAQRAEASSPPVTFTQNADITIPNRTTPSRAVPYGIALTMPAVSGTVVQATVTVRGLTHTAAFDLDILVSNPSGRAVMLMSDAGGTTDLNNKTITFDDSAASSVPTGNTPITDTRYRPTNFGTGDVMPTPALAPPSAGYGTQLSTFNSQNPQGIWLLWIDDDFLTAFSGSLSNGWTLTLTVDTLKGSITVTRSVSTSAKIQNVATADQYPSALSVTGLFGEVHSVRVRLDDVTHDAPFDLDIVLVSPSGHATLLMSDAGGTTNIANVDLAFDDRAGNQLPASTVLNSGTFRPTNHEGTTSEALPSPAPAEPFGTTLSEFDGTGPNGTWQLLVTDDRGASDPGVIGSWSLILEVNSAPVLGPIDDVLVNVGDGARVDLVVDDADGDVDSDLFSFTGSILPNYAFVAAFAGGFSIFIDPAPADAGDIFDAFVIANDGDLQSEPQSFQIQVINDQSAPTVTVGRSPVPNEQGWSRFRVDIAVQADDGADGSGVASIHIVGAGAATFDDTLLNTTQAGKRIVAEGTTLVSYEVMDRAGNIASGQLEIRLDATAPVITRPIQRLPSSGRLGPSTVPVGVTWTGQDALSGLQRFTLGERIDGSNDVGPEIPLSSPLAIRVTRQLTPAHSYRHCLKGVDNADVENEKFSCSLGARLTRVQEINGAIAYSSNAWTAISNAQFSGGATRFTTAAGETATYTFTGTSVAWVSAIGTGRGIAEVLLDGGTPVLVDLFAATQTTRQLVFARNGLADQSHTLTVRVTGDKNPASTGRRVDIDAFVTLRDIEDQ